MQEQLHVAIIQSDLVWENPKQNRANFKEKIKSITKPLDIIVLPEMFTTGFTMNASALAETMTGKTVTWMQNMATKFNAAIVGSIIITENEKFYNRLLFVTPDGTLEYYDKRHTFTLAGEDKVYDAGTQRYSTEYKGWIICPLICYDLRFPVWARNVDNYDVLLYVANWPKARIFAWDTLLKARAIENMSYVVGVNRIGLDQAQNEYCGHSAVYDVTGNTISSIKPNREQIEIVTLERSHINFYRNKLRFLDDKDDFTLLL
ncbi:amidohydrolase [Siansivirga zeaxanthinifaciens]|uniref:Omega-amidase YafV n=1 Tax=Siansivirga zeaxanthinifaciens CC-SAMT-1 TaxID=1454006 RepID=A0A0C5VTX3_9FLAO|nr:amidohydrolase [Siansivirga zeaxanthinifaciens]AJR02641.1 amidohydrolase [Siansivirga zeaxanthinifaciens CC-SAMT-1]